MQYVSPVPHLTLATRRAMLAGLVLGVTGGAACTTVRHVEPAALLANNPPAVVWVTDTSNTVVPIFSPEIRKDTLRGTLQGRRVKIPLSQIRSMEARVPNHAKTALLVTTLGVGSISAIYLALGSQKTGGMTLDCTSDEVTKHPETHPECFVN